MPSRRIRRRSSGRNRLTRSSPASLDSPSGLQTRGPRNKCHEPWLRDTRLGLVMGTAALVIALALLQNSPPRTSATKCDVIYYGIGQPANLPKAYECYAADAHFDM